ncbi:MAG TPA: threonine synthase [Thermomicrobiales bacterium]
MVATERTTVRLVCAECGAEYPTDVPRYRCSCGGLLTVEQPIAALRQLVSREFFDARLASRDKLDQSGVWRFRELLGDYMADEIVSKPEGRGNLYEDQRLTAWSGVGQLWLKHEGENPTGSFKDRGMTVGMTHARRLGARTVACASSGNTSASLASYAATADLAALTFVPEGKVSTAKIAQTIAYGARVIQIRGDFDAAMRLVQEVAETPEYGVYLLNSINPFRLEGQKTIVFDALQALNWQTPDAIVLPGGNLGNTSAFGKALEEALALGLIDRMPQIITVQAGGAAPFARAFARGFAPGSYQPVEAHTVASAIAIGDPVSYPRARRVIQRTEGIVLAVSDAAILASKAQIDRAGIGCEPASAAALAGLHALVADGLLSPRASVLAILTGNLMKDAEAIAAYHQPDPAGERPGANPPITIDPTIEAVKAILDQAGQR